MMFPSISSTAPKEVVLQAHDAENMKPAELDEIHFAMYYDFNVSDGYRMGIQGDHSGCYKPLVDFKTKVVF